MNKAQLIAAIADENDIKRSVVESVLDVAGRVITAHLASADADADAEVTLPGLGKLKTTTRAARTGRNPATGVAIEIPARVAVKFSASKGLDEALNPDL